MATNPTVRDEVADNAAANLSDVRRINTELREFVTRIRRAANYQRIDTANHLFDLADIVADAVDDHGELAERCAEADVRANPIR